MNHDSYWATVRRIVKHAVQDCEGDEDKVIDRIESAVYNHPCADHYPDALQVLQYSNHSEAVNDMTLAHYGFRYFITRAAYYAMLADCQSYSKVILDCYWQDHPQEEGAE